LGEPALLEDWTGEDVTLADVDERLGRLRNAAGAEGMPYLRTSVMTHLVWASDEWIEPARKTLAGMAERHPSRTIFLVPEPHGDGGIDAKVAVECYVLPGLERQVCSEIVELHLRGDRAHAPASIAAPLLISDLPVFCRWRGEPLWDTPEFDQLVELTDRLVLDSTEWPDPPRGYAKLLPYFEQTVVSDIAWARTSRWRVLLASLWPDVADVRTIRVRGTKAQAHLLCGWLRSRLGTKIELEHVEAERLEGIDLDGDPAPFPPGDPPNPSDVLSEELDRFSRDLVYEAAVATSAR
jgi:hypothetical protein